MPDGVPSVFVARAVLTMLFITSRWPVSFHSISAILLAAFCAMSSACFDSRKSCQSNTAEASSENPRIWSGHCGR
jgi:hypothetical protein